MACRASAEVNAVRRESANHQQQMGRGQAELPGWEKVEMKWDQKPDKSGFQGHIPLKIR